MSKRSDNLLIRDIQVSVERILKATAMLDQAGFESDVIIQDAVIRNFEVVGEAAKNLSAEIRSKNPDVDWQGMNGFRNFLIHVYFGVGYFGHTVPPVSEHTVPLSKGNFRGSGSM